MRRSLDRPSRSEGSLAAPQPATGPGDRVTRAPPTPAQTRSPPIFPHLIASVFPYESGEGSTKNPGRHQGIRPGPDRPNAPIGPHGPKAEGPGERSRSFSWPILNLKRQLFRGSRGPCWPDDQRKALGRRHAPRIDNPPGTSSNRAGNMPGDSPSRSIGHSRLSTGSASNQRTRVWRIPGQRSRLPS
jgi:hypothetical protein